MFLYKYGVLCLPIEIYNYLASVLCGGVIPHLNVLAVTFMEDVFPFYQ